MSYTSLYRYASAYWIGVCVYAMAHLIDRAFAPGGKRVAQCGAIAAALALILAMAPVEYAVSDLTLGGEERNKYYADHTGLYYLSRANVQAAHERLGDGDKVYVLSSTEIKPWLIARYELLPNRVCPWGEWDFLGDLAAWSRTLTDGAYDYVWVEYADEDFIGRCGAAFEGGVSVDTLYAVRQEEGKEAFLIPVFQANP